MNGATTTESIRIPLMLYPMARELAESYELETLTFEFTQPNAVVMREAIAASGATR